MFPVKDINKSTDLSDIREETGVKRDVIICCLLILTLISFCSCGDDKVVNADKPEDYDLVSVPPTSVFPMGWDGIETDEVPVHAVSLNGFSIGKYEVTYALWVEVKAWAESNGYTFYRDNQTMGWGSGDPNDQHPVAYTWWIDCVVWCNAYSEHEGLDPVYYNTPAKEEYFRDATIYGAGSRTNDCVDWSADGFRLPTEAEWECAARYMDASTFSSGAEHSGFNLFPAINDCASYNSNGRTTHPVGSFEPNSLGLYDMSGNAREWCWDWYDEGYYATSPSVNPLGPASGTYTYRVFRGGGASDDAPYCRTACRTPVEGLSYANSTSGFRVCRSVVAD